MSEEIEYEALLIDTSIFDEFGLKLDKGLLEKLTQFKNSPLIFLMPDVIFEEVKSHLNEKIKGTRNGLEKSINAARDYLFFDENISGKIENFLPDSKEIEGLAERRLDDFIENTGALILECGKYVNVSSLVKKYFAKEAPFDHSSKKNEFPDAIVLMAVDEWAKKNKKAVLAVTKDDDWARYCENSENITCIKNLYDGLTSFNKKNAPYVFLSKLEAVFESGNAQSILDIIEGHLKVTLDGFTPDQDADSYLYWEPEGSSGWFKSFYLISNEFKLIQIKKDCIVIGCKVAITVEAEGEFTLSIYDSIDKDYLHIDFVTARTEKEFESEILITIADNLDVPLEDLNILQVEIVSPIKRIHFGTIEPNFEHHSDE